MARVSSGGSLRIVELMLSKGAKNYDQVMVIAAGRGYYEIVELMLLNGAKNYEEAISRSKNIYPKIVELITKFKNTGKIWKPTKKELSDRPFISYQAQK